MNRTLAILALAAITAALGAVLGLALCASRDHARPIAATTTACVYSADEDADARTELAALKRYLACTNAELRGMIAGLRTAHAAHLSEVAGLKARIAELEDARVAAPAPGNGGTVTPAPSAEGPGSGGGFPGSGETGPVACVNDCPTPTATPTVAPTATSTAAPTATSTAAPTATPTAAPTATPTAAPTATPTAAPTTTPTVAPTATPAPSASLSPREIQRREELRAAVRTAGAAVVQASNARATCEREHRNPYWWDPNQPSGIIACVHLHRAYLDAAAAWQAARDALAALPD